MFGREVKVKEKSVCDKQGEGDVMKGEHQRNMLRFVLHMEE